MPCSSSSSSSYCTSTNSTSTNNKITAAAATATQSFGVPTARHFTKTRDNEDVTRIATTFAARFRGIAHSARTPNRQLHARHLLHIQFDPYRCCCPVYVKPTFFLLLRKAQQYTQLLRRKEKYFTNMRVKHLEKSYSRNRYEAHTIIGESEYFVYDAKKT